MHSKFIPYTILTLVLLIYGSLPGNAQSTAFSYQGRLTDTAAAANGTYQMQFALFDAPTGGSQIGETIERPAVSAVNGIFTTQLDFGSVPFAGSGERYLEVRVRRNSNESYATLSPRHPIGRVPYATNALSGQDERARMLGALRWDLFRKPTSYSVANPRGIAFDGTSIWVSSFTGNVVKIRPSDGVVLGTYAVGSDPRGMASDGTNIWVANYGSGTVTKLRASDGANQGTFAVGTNPIAICFDGTTLWVANQGSATVTRLFPADGTTLNTYSTVSNPTTAVFDGNVVLIGSTSGIGRQRTSDGVALPNYSVNGSVLTYDGNHFWTPVGNNADVYRVRSDGSLAEAVYVGGAASTMVYDGKYLWLGVSGASTVTRINPAVPASTIGNLTITLSSPATASAFDGTNVWFAQPLTHSVTKLPVYP